MEIYGSGSQVTLKPSGLGSCVYGTADNTTLGTMDEGVGAKLTLSATLPKISGALCPSTWKWEGTYIFTSHTATYYIEN